jgi:transcription initiation factor TFIID subunit 9B
MSSPPTTSFVQNNPDVPRDAKLIAHILESMGVEEYEPRVINQLLEFMHRYVTDVSL